MDTCFACFSNLRSVSERAQSERNPRRRIRVLTAHIPVEGHHQLRLAGRAATVFQSPEEEILAGHAPHEGRLREPFPGKRPRILVGAAEEHGPIRRWRPPHDRLCRRDEQFSGRTSSGVCEPRPAANPCTKSSVSASDSPRNGAPSAVCFASCQETKPRLRPW